MDNDKLTELIMQIASDSAATRQAIDGQKAWIKMHSDRLDNHDSDIESLGKTRNQLIGAVGVLSVLLSLIVAGTDLKDMLPF